MVTLIEDAKPPVGSNFEVLNSGLTVLFIKRH